jgi:hypothetical protein
MATKNNGNGKGNIPPMVNFDESQTIPGSITPNERYEQDLEEKFGKKPKQNTPNQAYSPDTPPINIPDPEKNIKISRPQHTASIPSKPVDIPVPPRRPPSASEVQTPLQTHTTDDIAEAIRLNEETKAIQQEQRRETKKEDVPNTPPTVATPVEIPEKINAVPPIDKPLPDEAFVQSEVVLESTEVVDETTTFINVDAEDKPVEDPPDISAPKVSPEPKPTPQEKSIDGLPQEETVEENSVSKLEIPEEIPTDITKDNPEGPFLKSVDSEEAERKETEEQERINKSVFSKAKQLTDAECITLNDYTRTHFNILEAVDPEMVKLREKGDIITENREIVRVQEVPDYEFRRLEFDKQTLDGTRRVQVVALQSGYTCMCKPMNSRELKTFGRRSGSENTYAYEMAICNAIYSKLSEFSTGPTKFSDWLNITAWPDLSTLIFGVYHATFPSKSLFDFDCNYCGQTISVWVDSGTLACIPPGNRMTQDMIQKAISGHYHPQELQKMSQRWSAIDVYVDDKRRYFRVKVPSIAEFLNNAYHNKNDDFISDNYYDMYYAGYIRGVGVLDIKTYLETGKATYYFDDNIKAIDLAIANIRPEEKRGFDRKVINYITQYSVAYQIPRVQCAKCHRIITQRDINPRTLFFETKARRGFGQ